ncbi:MAG: hypothetical protein JRH11_07905 [Deltaproteobacteria bacterium]|nr:hypothetical protein [Deltaproteobacteria bacterium]
MHIAPILVMVLLAAGTGGCSGEPTQNELRCRRLGGTDAKAQQGGLRVLVGSHVVDSVVTAGQVARCEGAAAAVFVAVEEARRRLPRELRRPVDVHLDPRGHHPPDGVETLIEHGALLVDGRRGANLDASIWLHELTHVAAAGSRPSDPIGGRLIAAVDEAAADYAAAAMLGRTHVGSPGPGGARDLGDSEALPPTAFQALAVGDGFDAHGFGLPLAAALLRREADAGALLTDLVTALGGRGVPWPPGVGAAVAVQTLVIRCPPRSREALAATLEGWLPPELRP